MELVSRQIYTLCVVWIVKSEYAVLRCILKASIVDIMTLEIAGVVCTIGARNTVNVPLCLSILRRLSNSLLPQSCISSFTAKLLSQYIPSPTCPPGIAGSLRTIGQLALPMDRERKNLTEGDGLHRGKTCILRECISTRARQKRHISPDGNDVTELITECQVGVG